MTASAVDLVYQVWFVVVILPNSLFEQLKFALGEIIEIGVNRMSINPSSLS